MHIYEEVVINIVVALEGEREGGLNEGVDDEINEDEYEHDW